MAPDRSRHTERGVQIRDHHCRSILRKRSLERHLHVGVHAQQIVEPPDHAVALEFGTIPGCVAAVAVAQGHEGALAGSDAPEAVDRLYGIVAAVDQYVLQRIIEVVLERRFVCGIGLDVVRKRLGLTRFFAGNSGRKKLLHTFGVIAAPALNFLERRIAVLHEAVFVRLLLQLVRNLFEACRQMRLPRILRSSVQPPVAAPS